jgi:hypothetical protein
MSEVVAPAAGTATPTPAAPVTPPAAPAAGVASPATPAVPSAPPAASPKVPETYALLLPEKSLLDPKAIERVSADAKSLGFTENAQAQRVLDAAHREVMETLKVMDAANAPGGALYVAKVAEWEKAALAHKELGNGDPAALKTHTLRGRLLVQELGPELGEELDRTGWGSKPEVLLFLTRIAARFAERPSPLPAKVPAGANDSLAKRMYAKELSGA